MEQALKRLERVLELEKQQGYQNKAVVGGIRQFAAFWVSQANEEAADESDLALVEQVSQVLVDYSHLPGKEARARAIDTLFQSIQRRRGRQSADSVASPVKEPPVKGVAPSSPSEPARKPAPTHIARQKAPRETPVTEDIETEPVDSEPVTVEPAIDYAQSGVKPDPQGLSQPVTAIKGVGQKIDEKLNKLGAKTIWELLYLFPRRYDDFTLMKPISKLQYGEQVTIIGTVWQTKVRRSRNNQPITESIVNDGTGSVQATWFNQPWLAAQLPAGMPIVLSGKVEMFLGRLVFNSPEWEPLEIEPLRTRRIVPVYPLTEGLTSAKMREVMQRAVKEWAPRVPDPLPLEIRKQRRLCSLPQAIQQLHFPDSQESMRQARRRLAYDELFLLQLGMQRQRRDWQDHSGMSLVIGDERFQAFMDSLPFQLTGAQQRVIDELRADMAQDRPMNRLLQGDVGSGKTIVAAAAMVIAACLRVSPREEWGRVPLLLAVAERERPGRLDGLDDRLFLEIQDELRARFASESCIVAHGRVSVVIALALARKLIADGNNSLVLIAATDSLLAWPTLSAYEREDRLLTPRNSNGFMPGEGAGALLVGQPTGDGELHCNGIGFAIENASIDSDEPLRADGLSAAIKCALADAGCELHDLDYRITDISGEQYYFKEAALALSRVLRQRKEEFELWHPAESIGETGATAGVAALAVAGDAARKFYAPGTGILAHFSNDAGRRAAAVLNFRGT